MGVHDSGYKLLFSYPFLVESLIRGFVPGKWLDELDFDSLETVSAAHPRENLGVRYDDVVWRLRWRSSGAWVYVYLMLELQSGDDPFMAVRILDYDGGLYRQLQRTLDLKTGDLLPIVLPVVLHTGPRAWSAELDVFDLITPAPPEVRPYLPHLRYLLLDAHAFAAEELAAMRNPVACNLWLEASEVFLTEPIELLAEILDPGRHADLRRAYTHWLTQAFLPSRIRDARLEPADDLEEVIVMMHENAIDWTLPWQEEGRRKGRREGEADLLLRQLARRFGPLSPAVEERVRRADAERLLAWGERFVDAADLEEVFDGKTGGTSR